MAEQVQESVKTDAGGCVAVSVGTSTTALAAAKATRVSLRIHNAHSATIYVQYGAAATAAGGFPLAAGASMEERDYTGAVNAIVAAATADVRVLEVG